MIGSEKSFIKENKLVAVIKANSCEDILMFAESCVQGGIKILEIILNNEDVLKSIEKLSKAEDILIGAGTVLNVDMTKDAFEAGARFVVSPHTDEQIIDFAKSKKLVSCAGAFTSSEIVNAWNLGVDFVKIFPAFPVGPKYIEAIKEPLQFVDIMVTGGVNSSNIADYLGAGASLVGVSSALLGENRKTDKDLIIKNARDLVACVKRFESSR